MHAPLAGRLMLAGAAAALMLLAAAIRLRDLAELDLFCDEAQSVEIASSLWSHGELNLFRYSRFLPDGFFRNGTIVYFPPLSYLVAAPFIALRDGLGPNIAPRLPALLSGLFLIGLLIPAARRIFGDARIGLTAAALTVCNGFHIGMSRMVLPYSLLPPLLLLALLAMLRVLRRGRRLDWIVATLSLTATAYVNQIALLFWPMLAPVGLAATRDRAALRRLATCIGVAAALFLIWVVALPRRAFFANSFFQTTSGYGFVPQLVKLATPYREMLAPWLLGVAFALGLVRLVFEAIRGREPPLAALLMWLVLPGAILLTRSMWILDYHLYAVYPPVILVAAYGVYTAARAAAILLRQPADGRLGGAILAVAVVGLCSSQWWFAPPAPSRSVFEFGSARVVSAAAAHIRQHDQGEIVIAPVGIAEAYYLERFVHSKNRPDAVARCLELVRDGPAWVFMGDNYFRKGQLDECDEYVRRHGTLILRAASAGVDDTEVSSGYALYHLAPPDRRP